MEIYSKNKENAEQYGQIIKYENQEIQSGCVVGSVWIAIAIGCLVLAKTVDIRFSCVGVFALALGTSVLFYLKQRFNFNDILKKELTKDFFTIKKT